MKQQLVQQPTLQRRLNQSLIQSIELLQFTSAELYDYIDEIAKENPLIEEVVYDGEAYSSSYQSSDGNLLEEINAAEQSLYDRLKEQLLTTELTDKIRPIVEFGIDSLDESGYLDITLEEWKETFNTSLPVIEEALDKIQELEPYGVGARSLGECLYLQVRLMDGYKPYMKDLLLDHLDWIADANYEAINDVYPMEKNELTDMMEMIQACNPKPGSLLEANDVEYIIPEAKIYKHDDTWRISFTHWRAPRLVISSFYQEMTSEAAKDFLKEKREQLNWLEGAMKYREATIELVIRKVVEKQFDFFERGLIFLQSMTLHDIAEELEVHLSTVSRAISNKHVETPHGVYPIKFFFQSGIQQGEGKKAAVAIKQLIHRLIEEEDKRKPLSDQSIMKKLQAGHGLEISRRTVMKYRQNLRIPASYKRRKE